MAREDYAETVDRNRLLWLEVAEDPRKDPRDVIYGRAVARAPDPMLMPGWEPIANPPDLAGFDIDPEIVRVVRPGQPDDNAGLAAMQPLIPSPDSPLHFALPLPPALGPDSPELFGFFTYEFRMGHPRGTDTSPYWSTAQGRFGPPTVIDGIQFPAPRLDCTLRASGAGWSVSSRHAQPVIGGRPQPWRRPNTEVWFVLYGRVMQVDGATRRNVQIGLRKGTPERAVRRTQPIRSRSGWTNLEIQAALLQIGMPPETPCSVLAVELLPEPNSGYSDPLQAELGEVRVLRSSRLVAVPVDCCVA